MGVRIEKEPYSLGSVFGPLVWGNPLTPRLGCFGCRGSPPLQGMRLTMPRTSKQLESQDSFGGDLHLQASLLKPWPQAMYTCTGSSVCVCVYIYIF